MSEEKKTKTEKTAEATSTATGREKRKKVYERPRESKLPQELVDYFKAQNYDLKLVRWASNGTEDYRYLARREDEGYEFVRSDEVPQELLRGMRTMDVRACQGMITSGDLCLMKIDSDLRNSRRKVYAQDAEREINAVDIHVLEKKGFRNLGTKSRVVMREPKFQE